MFSAYFVFQCLNMFCFEKQVSEFLATHFGYLRELPVLATRFGDLQAASLNREFTQNGFTTHSRLGLAACKSSKRVTKTGSLFAAHASSQKF